jgi:DNA modification methylase
MKQLIEIVTNPDDIVLDPFMGSGSTCVAAALTGRRYIGIELNEEYYNIASARISNLSELKEL